MQQEAAPASRARGCSDATAAFGFPRVYTKLFQHTMVLHPQLAIPVLLLGVALVL